uniref:Uncharacterized protein n=1 Tax=Fagus sylvatica TaxID=28930 RepID=A0A2N9FCQ4_FAGSY
MTIWELKKTVESKVTTAGGVGGGSSYQIPPLLIVDPLRYELAYSSMVVLAISAGTLLTQQPHLILSGGKEDLGALAMLEDNVKKRLGTPEVLRFPQSSWVGAVSWREFIGGKLDVKFEEAKVESKARLRDTMFFQIAFDGWKFKNYSWEWDDDFRR